MEDVRILPRGINCANVVSSVTRNVFVVTELCSVAFANAVDATVSVPVEIAEFHVAAAVVVGMRAEISVGVQVFAVIAADAVVVAADSKATITQQPKEH